MVDFGKKTVVSGAGTKYPVTLEAKCIAPNLTLHDLVKIYTEASKGPTASETAGDPSRWPVSLGVLAITDAINAAYEKQNIQTKYS